METSKTFRRAEIISPGTLAFRDIEKKKPDPEEVLIRVKSSAVCGSDVHIYRGKHPYTPFPSTFGHELAGVVEEVGQGTHRTRVGDRVCVEPLITCGECPCCRRGEYAYCEHLKLKYRSGFGGFAEYYYADERWLHVLPAEISFDEGALMEPLAVAVHAVGRGGVGLGKSVCVIGDGPVALMILQVARAAGADEVYLIGIEEAKLSLASTFGATALHVKSGDPVKSVMGKTQGRGVDVSFEVVGLNETFDQALSVVKKGGASVIVGIFEEEIRTRRIMDAMVREVSIVGTSSYCWDFQTAIDLVRKKRVNLKNLISHHFPLDRIKEAMEIKVYSNEQPTKILIHP